jgi:hypothetical protein
VPQFRRNADRLEPVVSASEHRRRAIEADQPCWSEAPRELLQYDARSAADFEDAVARVRARGELDQLEHTGAVRWGIVDRGYRIVSGVVSLDRRLPPLRV